MIRLIAGGLVMLGVVFGSELAHPRLFMTKAQEVEVKQRAAEDELVGKLNGRILKVAESQLKKRTCRYDIPDGKRLLKESRYALEITLHCGWAWRMTGEEKFRQRTLAELDAACGLKDWNPSHFLDTAEMCAAVAIGYDWLFETLSDEQKKRYEEAIVGKALLPAKKVYDSKGWWSKVSNNWSQVCAAGISCGAAAVEETEPELCHELLEQGRKLLEGCRVFYEPDGCYPEGPSYWHYGTNYQVMGYALYEGLGQPCEVPEAMEKTGDFIIHLIGPSRLPFNFADAGASRDRPTAAQSWLARHFQDEGQSRRVRQVVAEELVAKKQNGGRFMPLHVLWLPQEPKGEGAFPLAEVFQGEQAVAAFRSGWGDDAAFFAIKGGSAMASHGHMDVGSFVYDAGGVRWIHDLGSDNYNLPAYFGGKRWDYFRLNSLSHNVVTIGGQKQIATKKSVPLVSLSSERNAVAMDLGPVYAGQAGEVTRRASFQEKSGEVRMQDLITKPKGAVRWAIFTRAKARVDGRQVILEEGGKRLRLTRHDGAGGEWEISDARPPTEKEKNNSGYRMVSFTVPQEDELKLEVSWKLEK